MKPPVPPVQVERFHPLRSRSVTTDEDDGATRRPNEALAEPFRNPDRHESAEQQQKRDGDHLKREHKVTKLPCCGEETDGGFRCGGIRHCGLQIELGLLLSQ